MAKDLVLGIDVGGQTTKCGVVDAEGNILAQCVIRSDDHTDATEFVDSLSDALRPLIAEAGAEGRIKGIGMGAPNGNYTPARSRTRPMWPGPATAVCRSPKCCRSAWTASPSP